MIVKYTPEEAMLLGRAGIIAGVAGVVSATWPAVDIAENGFSLSKFANFFFSFLAFMPFAAVCSINWEKAWKRDRLNSLSSRIFVLLVFAFGCALFLFTILWLTGIWQIAIVVVLITLIVAWWQWPRMPERSDAELSEML